MAIIWELDFYSRPVLDEEQKKQWELLICESPQATAPEKDHWFRYSQICPSSTVNSLWLKEAIETAIAEAGESPQKIRFFRRQMNNMITKACEELAIPPAPSRHTYHLNQWLRERFRDFYPQQPGYDPQSAPAPVVQYPELNAIALPDAIRGDRGDKFALVSLEASAFEDFAEWEVAFGESFPLSAFGISPDTQIPGFILFSPRSLPLAGWLSGLELAYLKFSTTPRPRISLETGASDSWILADLTTPQIQTEAAGFEERKAKANNLHFLAIQDKPDAETFAGFWLLQESL
ncbi:MAG: Tab2/Atab2 family RNA-binding protein [Microcystaceae cyanobacterium]